MASPKIIGHQQGQSGNNAKIPAPFRIFPEYVHTFLQDSVIQNKITASDNHEQNQNQFQKRIVALRQVGTIMQISAGRNGGSRQLYSHIQRLFQNQKNHCHHQRQAQIQKKQDAYRRTDMGHGTFRRIPLHFCGKQVGRAGAQLGHNDSKNDDSADTAQPLADVMP